MHRIFIAINLPEDIKRELLKHQETISELFTPYRAEGSGSGPIRWTRKDNLHITLAFIGSVNDEEIPGILKAARETAERHEPFSINLNKICYGPSKKIPYSNKNSLTGRLDKIENRPPRMVWIEGEKSKELADLRDDLENLLLQSSGQKYQEIKSQPFSPHVTLGRIKEWEFKKIEPEERPEIETDINLDFDVNSIEVMESELKRAGPEYIVLESIKLGSS